jgi:hypothetical protein
MMASSAGFMTPTGCPTNIMVYAPGGYKFSDYMKYGGPLQVILSVGLLHQGTLITNNVYMVETLDIAIQEVTEFSCIKTECITTLSMNLKIANVMR